MKCPKCKQHLTFPTTSEVNAAKADHNNPAQWSMRCKNCRTKYMQNLQRRKLSHWFAFLCLLWNIPYWAGFHTLFEAGLIWMIPMIIVWWRMPALLTVSTE